MLESLKIKYLEEELCGDEPHISLVLESLWRTWWDQMLEMQMLKRLQTRITCCYGKALLQPEWRSVIGVNIWSRKKQRAVLLSSLVLPSPSSGPHWQSLTGSSRSNRNVICKAPVQHHKANCRTGAGAKRQRFRPLLPLTLQDSEGFAILSFVDCYQESYWI